MGLEMSDIDTRVVRCTSGLCRARIIFLKNPLTGKSVPCDADLVKPEDQEYDKARHISHFKTCADPNRFSKGKKK